MQNILQSLHKIIDILKNEDEKVRHSLWIKLLPQLKEMTQRGPGYGKILLNIASLSQKDDVFLRSITDQDLASMSPLSFMVDYIVSKEPGLIPQLVSAGLANEKNILFMLEKNSTSVADLLTKIVNLYGEDGLTIERKKVLNGMLYRELTQRSLSVSASDSDTSVRAVSKDEIIDVLNLLEKYKPILDDLGSEFIKTYMVQLYFANHSSIQKEMEIQEKLFKNVWSIEDNLISDFHKNLRLLQTIRLDFNKSEQFNHLVIDCPHILDEFAINATLVENERNRLNAGKKKSKSNAQKTPELQDQPGMV